MSSKHLTPGLYSILKHGNGLVNSYEPTRHYSGATELNTAGRRAEILARWTVFTKAAIEHRRMELALCNIGYMFTTSGTWRSCPKHAFRHWNILQWSGFSPTFFRKNNELADEYERR